MKPRSFLSRLDHDRVVAAIRAAEARAAHFPRTGPDRNELSDEVSED